jgi:hypothetical protein
MNDIKFKYLVKRQNGHVFSQVFTLNKIENGDANDWLKVNFVDRHTLHQLQYTGIKDKNGREGYRSDLVKHDTAIYQIAWQDFDAGFYMLHVAGTGWTDGLPIHNLVDSIIIGNAYENPELLEKDR